MFTRVLERMEAPLVTAVAGLGEIAMLSWAALVRLLHADIHWRNTLDQMAFIGVESLPIALLTALSVGMVFTLQISSEFIRYGATTVIGGVVAIALVRELGPTLTGVVVAGRVGAAIAAELGSMKVTEQIDALEVLAADPVRYLVLPRVLACLIMLPVLTFLSDLVGIAGGYVVASYVKGINPQLYLISIQQLLVPGDVYKGLIKAVVFGGILAVVGCTKGLTANNGAKGVGQATTSSVVVSLLSIFVVNYFLSLLLFPGGHGQ